MRAILTDKCPLGVARVQTGLSTLIKGHTKVAAGDRRTRWQAFLSILGLGAVDPAQLARGSDVAQSEPHSSFPGEAKDGLHHDERIKCSVLSIAVTQVNTLTNSIKKKIYNIIIYIELKTSINDC